MGYASAGDWDRTGTMSPPQDYKYNASASSATPAESFETRANEMTLESEKRPFFEISESEPKAKLKLNEKNLLQNDLRGVRTLDLRRDRAAPEPTAPPGRTQFKSGSSGTRTQDRPVMSRLL